jgi:uncharacterized protein (DUF1800 family)
MEEVRPGPRPYRPGVPQASGSFPARDYDDHPAAGYDQQGYGYQHGEPGGDRFGPAPDPDPQYDRYDPEYGDPHFGDSPYGDPRHGDAPYGDAPYADAAYSDAPYGGPEHGDKKHRRASTGVLTRRNALLAAAVVGAGGGTAYLMRNVGSHGSPASAPAADVPGVTLPVPPGTDPGQFPSTLPREVPKGQPPAKTAPTAGGQTQAPSGTGRNGTGAGGSTQDGPGGRGTAMLQAKLDPEMLLRRATYGPTAAMRGLIKAAGPAAWLNQQLAPASIPDAGGANIAKLFPRLRLTSTQVNQQFEDDQWKVMYDLVAAHIGKAIWSDRQLFEVMVDFWANHLNINCPNGDVWDTRHRYDADVIRANALGNFGTMLAASAFHPAMLRYLNNADSTKDNPNENYARELMELHTVGVNGGYTETDVKHAALLLTGWRVEDGKAIYNADRHFVGPVKVMGFGHPNAAGQGQAAQRAFLGYLAKLPATAKRIGTKLAVRFAGDNPPATLVAKLATAYTKNGGAIAPVLRTLFTSPEFAASAGAKVRRPFEQLVATARAIGVRPSTDPEGLMQLYWMLSTTGHQPLAWPQPNGYPDVASAWQSPAAALSVFNTTANLVHGWYPNKLVLPGAKGLLTNPPTTRAATVDAVATKVLGRKASAAERNGAATLLAGTKLPATFKAGSWEQQETVALTTLLLLSSPAHLVR